MTMYNLYKTIQYLVLLVVQVDQRVQQDLVVPVVPRVLVHLEFQAHHALLVVLEVQVGLKKTI